MKSVFLLEIMFNINNNNVTKYFNSLKRVAIFHPGTLGDAVLCIPCFKSIRRNLGRGVVLIMIHESSPERVRPIDVLEGTGEVDEFIDYPLEGTPLKKIFSAVKFSYRIRKRKFDAVIYLVPVKRDKFSVQRDELFFRICGIKKRIGFIYFPEKDWVRRDAQGNAVAVKHEAEWKLHRLHLAGFDISDEMALLKQPYFKVPVSAQEISLGWLNAMRKSPDRHLVGLCLGTGMPSKAWPADNFVELIKKIQGRGDCEVLLLGGNSDKLLAMRIINSVESVLDGVGKFSVLVSAGLVLKCNLYIGQDTGLTHVAATLGINTIGIYSMTNPIGSYSPLGNTAIVLTHPVPCAGCWNTVCPVAGHPCMKNIPVDDVMDAVNKCLALQG